MKHLLFIMLFLSPQICSAQMIGQDTLWQPLEYHESGWTTNIHSGVKYKLNFDGYGMTVCIADGWNTEYEFWPTVTLGRSLEWITTPQNDNVMALRVYVDGKFAAYRWLNHIITKDGQYYIESYNELKSYTE